MKIDPSKKYQTRDGKPVEFLHRAPEGWPGGYPWRGSVEKKTVTWDEEGREFSSKTNTSSDLVEVREPIEFSQVIDGSGRRFNNIPEKTLAEWDSRFPHDAPHRIATFREVTP